ncbi:MAG TPA: hypothetical protein VLG50_06695 [Candidatus Saccharimonadales bacterium]|nr:hypothetical protein [Candidatus Saccharimonadales bacterium]
MDIITNDIYYKKCINFIQAYADYAYLTEEARNYFITTYKTLTPETSQEVLIQLQYHVHQAVRVMQSEVRWYFLKSAPIVFSIGFLSVVGANYIKYYFTNKYVIDILNTIIGVGVLGIFFSPVMIIGSVFI